LLRALDLRARVWRLASIVVGGALGAVVGGAVSAHSVVGFVVSFSVGGTATGLLFIASRGHSGPKSMAAAWVLRAHRQVFRCAVDLGGPDGEPEAGNATHPRDTSPTDWERFDRERQHETARIRAGESLDPGAAVFALRRPLAELEALRAQLGIVVLRALDDAARKRAWIDGLASAWLACRKLATVSTRPEHAGRCWSSSPWESLRAVALPPSLMAIEGDRGKEKERSITPPSGSAATLTLDALGRPMTRMVGSSVDTYGYVGPSLTTYETGSASTDAIYDASGAQVAIKTGSTVSFVIFDLHGSVVALCPSGSTSLSDA